MFFRRSSRLAGLLLRVKSYSHSKVLGIHSTHRMTCNNIRTWMGIGSNNSRLRPECQRQWPKRFRPKAVCCKVKDRKPNFRNSGFLLAIKICFLIKGLAFLLSKCSGHQGFRLWHRLLPPKRSTN